MKNTKNNNDNDNAKQVTITSNDNSNTQINEEEEHATGKYVLLSFFSSIIIILRYGIIHIFACYIIFNITRRLLL